MEQEWMLAGGGEVGARMRAMNWSQTPLGAVADWPPALRIAVGTVLGTPHPHCLFWGHDFIALYNDGYRRLLGDKHPAALGAPSQRSFAELWSLAGPLLEGVLRTQTAISREDQLVILDRQGFLEEAAFTFSCSPLRDEHGRGVGVWCLATETTPQVLATRRSRLLRELALRTASARDAGQVLRTVGEVLATAGPDVPFALLSAQDGTGAHFGLRVGLGADTREPSPWPVAEVLASRAARLVEDLGAEEGVRAGPWPEPVRRALLLPLALDGGEVPDAVLGLGLSPRLPLDEAYRDFLGLIARQLAGDLTRIRADTAHVRLASLLHNAPAFVCTLRGPEHVFELVNPLYRQLMGPGRPFLGLPVREAVPEMVEQGALAQLDAVYHSGEPFFGRDFHALVDRRGTGQLEELFVTFVYQPRRDARGEVEGIDVFGFEVSQQVLAWQRAESLAFLLRESEARQRRVVEASDAGLWELYLTSGRITMDEQAASLFGLAPGTFPTLAEALEYAHAEDRERLARAIFAALSGEREGRFFEVFRAGARGGAPARWLECRGQRFQDVDGRPTALAGALLDITPRKQAELERERLLKEVEASRHRLSGLIENAPALVCTLSGPRHVFEMFNPPYQQMVGVGRPLLGLRVEEALPEAVEQGFLTLLDTVYRTGEPFLGRELSILLDRHAEGPREEAIVNFVYQPRRDVHGQVEGIDVFGFEVTEQVRARQRAEVLAEQLRESEARLRRVVEASGVGLWELEATTGRMTADARVVELMGLPPSDTSAAALGTPLDLVPGLALVHPEDREPLTRAISRALAGDNEERSLLVFRIQGRGDAPERWVESRAQRRLSTDGRRVTLAGVLLDVTERTLMERFRARQARLHVLSARVGQSLARGTTVRGLLQACTEALVSQLRAALVRIWLYAPARDELLLEASDGLSTELEGPHARLRPGTGKVGWIARERRPHLTNSLQTDVLVGDPEWVRREKLTAFAGYPMLVGDTLVGVLAVYAFTDLPEDTLELLHQVAEGIAQGVERLRAEEALRTRVDFEQKLVGIVSHDLRNPLNAILMGAQLLSQREQLDERTLKSVLRIQAAAERATRLVEDLLDFTQARLGGGLRLAPRPSDLHEVTRGVVEEVEAAHPARQLELRHEGEGRGLFDADRLGQVVQNLLTNALKYSPEDSLVRILTWGEEGGVSLTVSNTNLGPPIATDKLAIIFEPMQRATAEVDKVGRSVGLGLYIVKSIVQAHGGNISVVSTRVEGTVFTVRLPRQPPEWTAG